MSSKKTLQKLLDAYQSGSERTTALLAMLQSESSGHDVSGVLADLSECAATVVTLTRELESD